MAIKNFQKKFKDHTDPRLEGLWDILIGVDDYTYLIWVRARTEEEARKRAEDIVQVTLISAKVDDPEIEQDVIDTFNRHKDIMEFRECMEGKEDHYIYDRGQP